MTTVQVEQSDREAAARIHAAMYGFNSPGFARILEGACDSEPHVQILAQHRITAATEAIERAAKVADQWAEVAPAMDHVVAINTLILLPVAIRNLSPTPAAQDAIEDTRYTGAEVDRSGYADADLPLPDFTRACTTPSDDAAREALARWIEVVQIADGATAGEFRDVLVGMVRGGSLAA